MPISVLIVDDHPVVRQGLRVLLEVQDGIQVAGEAGDGPAALKLAAEHAPDVILLDLKLPGHGRPRRADELKARDSASRVLVLTSVTDPVAAGRAMRAGAAGVLYKDVDPDALVRAIRAVHDGHLLLAPEAAGTLLRSATWSPRTGRRSPAGSARSWPNWPGPLQPRDRPRAERLGEDGQGPRELGAGQARRAGPHPGRAVRRPPRARILIDGARDNLGPPGSGDIGSVSSGTDRLKRGPLMSDEVLRLRGVEVRRDAAVLLRNVDWTAHEDERWILIGPNGAGKTTLLQVAATTLFPTQGTVEVLGERLGEVDIFDLRPRIGLTSAAIAEQVPPDEKVIDLVLTASYAILGRWKEDYDSADVTRAVELLDALGCAHLIRRKFATLSEGERKRVQIARAMMPDPELLLLDEPAAGLDLGGREDLLRRLTTLARDPKAPMMVLVTHHVEEVPDGFTHAMLLRRGSVLAAGPIDEVFTARNLSRCFGVQLEIEHRQSRWTARAS